MGGRAGSTGAGAGAETGGDEPEGFDRIGSTAGTVVAEERAASTRGTDADEPRAISVGVDESEVVDDVDEEMSPAACAEPVTSPAWFAV